MPAGVIGSARPRSVDTLSWVAFGSSCTSRAAAPAVSGVLNDVPHAPA